MLRILNRTISRVHSAALLLGAAGFLSKLLGLLRDRMLAGRFGASRELDVYYAAFQIPDFVYTILLLGAGSMAILPIFVEILERSRQEAEEYINALITFFCAVTAVLVFIGIIITPLLIALFFPGFDSSSRADTVFLTRIIFLSPLFLGISGILTSPIQTYKKFFAYAVSSIFYNIGIIAGIVCFVPFFGARGLAFGVVLGALLHVSVQWHAYRSLGFTIRFLKNFFTASVIKTLFLSFPRIVSLMLRQATSVVLVGIASTLASGSIAVYQFANNLSFLPIGLFAISYATALFPRVSENVARKDAKGFYSNVFWGMRMILFWVMPCAFLFVVLRAHIVRVTLGTGFFDWTDSRLTAAVFAVLTIAFIAESLNGLFLRAFYALKEAWVPLWLSIIATIISIGGAFLGLYVFTHVSSVARIFYRILRVEDVVGGEIIGVMLGVSVGIVVNAFLLLFFLLRFARKKFNGARTADLKTLFVSLLKISGAALMCGVAAYGTLIFLSNFFVLDTFKDVFIEGMIAGVIGFVLYVLLLFLMKSEDVHSIKNALHRRLFSPDVLPKEWNGERVRLE